MRLDAGQPRAQGIGTDGSRGTASDQSTVDSFSRGGTALALALCPGTTKAGRLPLDCGSKECRGARYGRGDEIEGAEPFRRGP